MYSHKMIQSRTHALTPHFSKDTQVARERARGKTSTHKLRSKCTQNRTQYDLEQLLLIVCNKLDAEIGAQGESRTHTPVKAGDFESPASTIPPLGHWVGD